VVKASPRYLAQDVPKPSVHLFEHGDVLVRRGSGQAAQAGHGRVHPVVAGGRCFDRRTRLPAGRRGGRPGPFGIKVLTLSTLVWVFLVHVRYPPRGTLPSDVD